MEQIEKILVEIQRLKKELDGHTASEGLDYIESYINLIRREYSLPSDLEEAKHEFSEKRFPNEKMAPLRRAARIGYEAGAEWQKEQMMKGAVEADVNTYRDLAAGKSWAEFVIEMPTNNLGDKVRIIIVKEG